MYKDGIMHAFSKYNKTTSYLCLGVILFLLALFGRCPAPGTPETFYSATPALVKGKKLTYGKQTVILKPSVPLVGDIYTPLNSSKGCILFYLGLGDSKDYIDKDYVEAAIEANLTVVVPDLRGHGQSGGYLAIKESVRDIESTLKDLEDHFDNIVLAGYSYGGYLSFLAATTSDKEIRNKIDGLVLFSSLHSLVNYLKRVLKSYKFLLHLPKPLKFLVDKPIGFYVSRRYKFRIKSFYSTIKEIEESPDLLNYTDSIKTPVLIIHGVEDELINHQGAVNIFKKLKAEHKDVELHLIESSGEKPADHATFFNYKDQIIPILKEWLKRTKIIR